MSEVFEYDGPRGGQYYCVDLEDGRRMAVSRKDGDDRVWFGVPVLGVSGGHSTSKGAGQRGGIGTADKLLEEWSGRIALDPDARELYSTLRALVAHKESPGAG
jgi:hypothetical protein